MHRLRRVCTFFFVREFLPWCLLFSLRHARDLSADMLTVALRACGSSWRHSAAVRGMASSSAVRKKEDVDRKGKKPSMDGSVRESEQAPHLTYFFPSTPPQKKKKKSRASSSSSTARRSTRPRRNGSMSMTQRRSASSPGPRAPPSASSRRPSTPRRVRSPDGETRLSRPASA